MPLELLGPSFKQRLQDIPWRLTRELSLPVQRPCSAPQLRASWSQHPLESSLHMGKTHPPWGSGFTCVLLLGDFYLLDIKVDVNCVICMKLNMTYVHVEWPTLSDLVFVTGCDVMGFPFPWKLKSNSCEEASAISGNSTDIIPQEFPLSFHLGRSYLSLWTQP